MGQGGVSGLVTGTIFKIAERQVLSLAGSIPVRLRHAARNLTWMILDGACPAPMCC